jgi:hypothetical protein
MIKRKGKEFEERRVEGGIYTRERERTLKAMHE